MAEHDQLLPRWLTPVERSAFDLRYWGREPLATAGTASEMEVRYDWSRFEAVLASPRADVIVMARGRALSIARPRDLKGLREQFGRGVGLTVRAADELCPVARSLGEALSRELGGLARVHLFATPAETQGFGWHYDDEHVFIVQTAGSKDYFFRENTVAKRRPAGGEAFASYPRESSRLLTARLVPGDVLYLPARWWHMAISVADSLSVSIGVTDGAAESTAPRRQPLGS